MGDFQRSPGARCHLAIAAIAGPTGGRRCSIRWSCQRSGRIGGRDLDRPGARFRQCSLRLVRQGSQRNWLRRGYCGGSGFWRRGLLPKPQGAWSFRMTCWRYAGENYCALPRSFPASSRCPFGRLVRATQSKAFTGAVDLVSGRHTLIERSWDFTLVPWRPALERQVGKTVSGLVRADGVNWTAGRGRPSPVISSYSMFLGAV